MSKKKIILLSVLLFVFLFWGFGFGFLLSSQLNKGKTIDDVVVNNLSNNPDIENEEGLSYYSDGFMFAGKGKDGKYIVGEIELRRYEGREDEFLHQYTITVDKEGKQFFDTYSERNYDHEIVDSTNKFQIDYSRSEDLSTRESYQIKWEMKQSDGILELSVDDLESDFIARNQPEYIKYISAKKGELIFNDEVIEINIMHESIFSTDYSKYIFFDGFNEVVLEGYLLVLWDEEGGFYLIDVTDVESEHKGYKSHSWALTKSIEGEARKGFDLEGVKFDYDGEVRNWKVNGLFEGIGDLETYSVNELGDDQYQQGVLKGTVQLQGNTQQDLIGIYKHYTLK